MKALAPLLVAWRILSGAPPDPVTVWERLVRHASLAESGYTDRGTSYRAPTYRLLRDAAARLGVEVQHGALRAGVYGLSACEDGRRIITLAEGVSLDAQTETLAHELGHHLIPDAAVQSTVAELIAESTGAAILALLGERDYLALSARWAAPGRWALPLWRPYRPAIRAAVARVQTAARRPVAPLPACAGNRE